MIQTNSQDIAAKACPNYQREMIEDNCLAHADALKKWEYIRDFLEPPVSVSIDSAIVFKGGARTAYVLPNINDTIKSPGDSIFLKGRTNVYFLANAEAKVSLNGSGYLTMQWPSALGREGQGFFYKIPQEYLFVPENYIEVKIKSVDSDNQTNTGLATTRLYYNPWAVFITIITPPIDTIYRFPEFVPIKVAFSAPAPKESLSLYYQVPDDTTFYQVPNDSFTYIPGILTDTLRLDFIDGRYLIKVAIKDGDKSYQTVWPFFVDNTPPEIVITSPHLEGSELMVYSPNADTIMPVIFIATDNLQWYFPNPPDRRATVEILDSLNNMLYSKDAENVWFGQGSRVWIRLDSINFVYDGKYYARVSISDRAGNDTTAIDSFLIDTTPPEITVLQPLSPNPFTFDDPCMTFIFTTNEWTEISLKYTNLNDTTKVYERSLIFPYWDIDTNGVRDTLYIVESENWYGCYLPDGHYKAKAWAKDKAGNTTEITEFCPETLKVDKTRPIIKDCYCQPFVVKTDSAWTTLYFKQNEDDDVPENKKGLTARIYLDTIFIGTTPESNYDSTFDVGFLARGQHTFRIESYDWAGNKSIHSAQFVKGSLGSEITYPAEGDSNLTGIIVIKGWASDPNLENSEPFGKYELWYKRKPEVPRGFYSSPSRRGEGGTGWQAIGIWVPEGYREPGGPQNRSIKEVITNSTIGYWDLRNLREGEYILRLTTYEKGTESLSVVYRNVKVKGGVGIEISVDTVIPSVKGGNGLFPFEPLNGETLFVDYEISKSCGNVNLEIFNPNNKKVFSDYGYNIVPYKGAPEILNVEGYYFYEGEKEGIGVNEGKDGNDKGNEYELRDTNTIFWCKWFDLDTTDYTSWSGIIEGIDGSYIEIIDSIGSIYFNVFGNKLEFTGISNQTLNGFSFKTDNKEMRLTFKKNGMLADNREIFFGKSKAKAYDNPIIIKEKKPFRWDGITEWGSYAGSGLYRVKISAEGWDNQGYAEKVKNIQIITPFEIDSLWVIPTEFYPSYDTILNYVTLYYRLIQDGYVKIEVIKDNEPIIQLCDGKYIKGNWTGQVSWDGRHGSNIAEPDTYYFRLTAVNSDSTDSVIGMSPPFYALNSVPVGSLIFSIPQRYFRGIVGDSVYDGLGEFSFSATANGEIYPPQEFSYKLDAEAYKFRNVDWKVRAFDIQPLSGTNRWKIGIHDCPQIELPPSGYHTYTQYTGQWQVYSYITHGLVEFDSSWLRPGEHAMLKTSYTQGSGFRRGVYNQDRQYWCAWITGYQPDTAYLPDTTSLYRSYSGYHPVKIDSAIGNLYESAWLNDPEVDANYDFSGDTCWPFANIDFITCNGWAEGRQMAYWPECQGQSITINKYGVELRFGEANNIFTTNIYLTIDTSSNESKWAKTANNSDTCFYLADSNKYGVADTLVLDLLQPSDTVDQRQWLKMEATKTTGHSCVKVDTLHREGLLVVRGSVDMNLWNPTWQSLFDENLVNGIIKADSPLVFTDEFDIDGLRNEKCEYSFFYPKSGRQTGDSLTFWYFGANSNPWLKVDDWQTVIIYPDGDTNSDLSLGNYYTGGFGQNVHDWFKPKLNKIHGIEQPKKWIEIDGICNTYYKMLYWDGEKIGYITKMMMPPKETFGPLCFWDVSMVYGNVNLILQHFSDSLDTYPDSIKIARVKIGQPAGPNFVAQTVHSPYWRAQLNFSSSSFNQDTIAAIMPVSIRNCGLGGNVPYLGENVKPVVWLRPKGAKFPDPLQRPTLTYRFNNFELDTFDIDTTHLTFYAVSDEGDLIEFPSSHSYDGNTFLIILAPNFFPGDTTHSIFAVLDTTVTVRGRPKIENAIVEAGRRVRLIGKANPNQYLFAIATDPLDDIYDIAELLRSGRGSGGQERAIKGNAWQFVKPPANLGEKGDTIDSISFYSDSLGNYSVELEILTGKNKIFVFDGKVKDFMKTQSTQMAKDKKESQINTDDTLKKNCAVAYRVIELDTIPHLEIAGERYPVIEHIFEREKIRVVVNKSAQVYYSRYDLEGELDERAVFSVTPYETLSIWWDGKDRYGNYAGNGEWWYKVYAKDEFGRVSNEEQGYFLVAQGVPIEIVSPTNNSKNAGIVNLRAEILNGGDYPVSWKFYNQFWGDIGIQPHPGVDFQWDTRQVYDGRDVLITATSVDPLGNLGSDTISIMIDNTPPEIILTKGQPSYEKYIRWQTQLTLTAIDTLAGLLSARYKIDTGNWNDFYNSVQFNLNGYDQGSHNLNIETKDSLQNLREKTFDLFIDEQAPLLGFKVGLPSNYYNGIWYVSSQTPINLWGRDSVYQNDGSGIGLVKFSIDDGPWQTENDSLATIFLIGDGWHKVSYQTVDRVANASPIKLDSFYVDNYPPITEIHIDEPKYGDEPTYITSNTLIWFTATDSGVGVWYTEYSIGDTMTFTVYREPFTVVGLPDGEYKIYYRSVDYAGNIEETKEELIYLDNTPPEITIEIGEPKYGEEPVYLRRFTQIKITVHDEGCGVDSARYKIEPGDWNYFANSVQFDLQNYEEGLHNFFTYAIDHLGNNQTIIKILAIDETPPNTDLTIGEPNHPLPGDSVLITSQTPLDLLAYDVWSNGVASGVENLAYRFTYLGQFRTIEGNLGQDNADQSRLLQNNKWSSETRFAQNDWVIIPDSIASLRCEGPDGWYRFDYYAQDHVENREEINSNNLVLDNTPPEGMIISPLDSTLANRTIKIIGTANDLHFALYQVYYGIGWDPQNWTLIKESNTPVINGLLTEWNTDLLNDGRYTIRLVVRDLVNNQTEDRVLIIVGEPEYSFEITGFNKCEGVAVDEAGYIYVADRNSNPIPEHNRIAKFDPYGNLILNIFDVRKPNGVDIDAYGNIYASEWAGDCITKFSPTGESLMTVTGFNKPNGVAVDRLSQIYIADQNNNRVVRTDREGNFNLIITGLGHPEGVDFCSAEIPQNTGDRRGIRIYTTDTEAGKIKVFDEFGNLMLEFGEGLNQPADVEVDSRGYIWVVDRNNNRILCYDFFGNRLLDFGTIGSGPGEFNKPEGVAVSEISGGVVKEVFVADRNNDRVCKFIIPYLIEPEISLTSRSPASPALEITEAIAYPSPFDPNKGVCRIRVTLTAEADVKLTIYTLSGKVVYRDEIFSGSGIIEFVWDGRNEIGEMVNNGVYGFLVQAKSGSESKEKEGKFFVIKE
ncbi:MAG: FlgD immunoglobulin-like domain containing protein [candidate division WOR-3 bacterium]